MKQINMKKIKEQNKMFKHTNNKLNGCDIKLHSTTHYIQE